MNLYMSVLNWLMPARAIQVKLRVVYSGRLVRNKYVIIPSLY